MKMEIMVAQEILAEIMTRMEFVLSATPKTILNLLYLPKIINA